MTPLAASRGQPPRSRGSRALRRPRRSRPQPGRNRPSGHAPDATSHEVPVRGGDSVQRSLASRSGPGSSAPLPPRQAGQQRQRRRQHVASNFSGRPVPVFGVRALPLRRCRWQRVGEEREPGRSRRGAVRRQRRYRPGSPGPIRRRLVPRWDARRRSVPGRHDGGHHDGRGGGGGGSARHQRRQRRHSVHHRSGPRLSHRRSRLPAHGDPNRCPPSCRRHVRSSGEATDRC